MGNQPEAVDQQEAGAANHKRNNIEEIAAVIDYIEEHLMEEKMDLESIASIFHYSRYHLHRMFASVAGFPLHTYLTRRRLTEAARLLVWTDRPVLEIALASGYETQRSFSRAFQKYFQHSPSRYRKKGDFFPLQLKYDVFRREKLRGDRIITVTMREANCLSSVTVVPQRADLQESEDAGDGFMQKRTEFPGVRIRNS